MFSNNNADSVPELYLYFLTICLTYRRTAMIGADSTLLLVLQPLSIMSRVGRLHSRIIASASDVVVDMIPDRETEVNQYYSSQLKKKYFFIFYWWCWCRTEESPLGGLESRLRPPYGVKWATQHLFKYIPRYGGPGHFREQFENL
jgi:hypothetical protein